MDSRDKRFAAGIEKALVLFDSLEEWADYIAFLSKLLKALQQKHTTPHWVPHDLAISIRLSKCLSPNLPSGVHSKTLELYQFIFQELGIEKLSGSVNTWVPGILPIMQFASISIKPLVIDLYTNYVLTLPDETLSNIVKPLLTYLLPSIDDERSEFFDSTMSLIDSLQRKLNNDSLFWQSIFLITITSDERRLGCLVWFNKRLPDLNYVVAPPEDIAKDTQEYYKAELQRRLTSDQLSLITPEPGLLIRAFTCALKSTNLLIQRGFFDLLIKKLELDSTVLQRLTPAKDLRKLVISVVSAILKKDMSINRRVWNWLLGPETTSALHLDYFRKFGAGQLIEELLQLINGKSEHRTPSEQQTQAFKITLASMDRWEIGSELIPNVFIPALKAVKVSHDNKALDKDVLKCASALFDAVETLVIYSNIFDLVTKQDITFVLFILQNFNVTDEEMIVHQMPLILITAIAENDGSEEWMNLLQVIMHLIPQRAYLPIEHASEDLADISSSEAIKRIASYYCGTDVLDLPFQPADLSVVTLNLVTELTISNIQSEKCLEFVPILNSIIDTIPELKYSSEALVEILHSHIIEGPAIIELAKLFTRLNFTTPVIKVDVLRSIVFQLCTLLKTSGDHYQVEIVKTLHQLTLTLSPYYVEAAITSYLLSLESVSYRLHVFNFMWIHSQDISLLDRPLHIILDDLDQTNGAVYTILQGWIQQVVNSGSINILFQLITAKLNQVVNDNALFTYHASLLYRVLTTDPKTMLRLLHDELTVINSVEYKDEDVSTYKDFTLFQLNRFVKQRTFDATTLGSILNLYGLLLDGSESWFESHVTQMFELAKDITIEEVPEPQFRIMATVLFSHLTQLTRLLVNTHQKVADVLVKEGSQGKPFIVDFLISTFERFNTPGLLNTWIGLLSASLKFQDEYIFKFVQPIVLTMLRKVNVLYSSGETAKDDISIAMLLTELQEVLSLFRTYVISIEINSSKNSYNDPGFFSTVAGVFNADSGKRDSGDQELLDNRLMLSECYKEAINTSFTIWKKSDQVLRKSAESENSSLKYQSLKLKHKSKFLMEKLYEQETIEVLKTLVASTPKDETHIVFKLLHVLDSSRPQFTIPFIFKLLNHSVQDKMMRPTTFEVSEFLLDYTTSLQDDTIEDIYEVSMGFLKTVSDDLNTFKPVLLTIVKLISVLGIKLSHSRFGSQRKVKKELTDFFLKIYPTSLNFKNAEISSALSGSINDQTLVGTPAGLIGNEESTLGSNPAADVIISQEDIIRSIQVIIPRLKHTVADADKQHSVVSTILITLLTPSFKSKSFPSNIHPYHLDLLNELLTNYPNTKSLRFLVSELFNDSNFFSIKIRDVANWNEVLSKWLLNEPNDKITDYLTKSTQSMTNMNIFNWNENEQLLKKLMLKRVAYLLLISNKDQHIVLLKDLFNKLDFLLQQSDLLLSEVFLVLRVIVLKFSEIHLYDYWTMIYTALQTFFLKLLKSSAHDKLDIGAILQASKLLDLILVLKFEDFQEWIFIIDTINAIYKNAEIISLVDQISLNDELFKGDTTNALVLNKSYDLRVPALLGVETIESLTYLKPFFDGLSYYNFENVYNGGEADHEKCEQDLFADLFEGQ